MPGAASHLITSCNTIVNCYNVIRQDYQSISGSKSQTFVCFSELVLDVLSLLSALIMNSTNMSYRITL